ncbi:MAG: chloride channel protein [Acidimicrobiales bacterium]|nr:chloride channel protein [Acidimicrobiales bacterium]
MASLLLGLMVGAAVSILEWIVLQLLLHTVRELPLWALACAPMVGLGIATLTLRTIGGGITPSTSDEYIRAYHQQTPYLRGRDLFPRMMSGVATIGLGGAVGLEGPAIYAGSMGGLRIARTLRSWLGADYAKVLLTAGAAAGISSLFQAPATGVVFALEAPYRDDLAHRALLPSLVASAAGYLAFVSIALVEPETVLPFAFDSGIGTAQLVGAVLLGLGAGFGGRVYAWCVRRAKAVAASYPAANAVVIGGAILAGLAVLSDQTLGSPITLGPGLSVVEWLLEEEHAVGAVLLVFVLRAVATFVTVGAGGTGGFFIPLAMQGVLFGSVVGNSLDAAGLGTANESLWPVLGLAAFLGAGYRTPLAAVMFVAESTGGGAVVPALVAAAVSQLVAGPSSVSTGQMIERTGLVEGKANSPVANVLKPIPLSVPPDSTVYEFIHNLAIGQQVKTVPVLDGSTYLGLLTVASCSAIDRDEWNETKVTDVMDADAPVGSPNWYVRDAMVAMQRGNYDMLAILSDDVFVGVVSAEDIVRLEEIIEVTR